MYTFLNSCFLAVFVMSGITAYGTSALESINYVCILDNSHSMYCVLSSNQSSDQVRRFAGHIVINFNDTAR